MATKKFAIGALIKTLRQDRTGGVGRKNFTQRECAEEVKITYDRYQKIEQGKRKPYTDELVTLAELFKLTQRERENFFYVASLERNNSIDLTGTRKILNEMIDKLNQVELPVLVGDQYMTVIAYNEALAKFYGADPGLIENYRSTPTKLNIVRLSLSGELKTISSLSGNQFDDFVTRNIKFFRGLTLEYQATAYYKSLIDELDEEDEFEKYWHLSLHQNDDSYQSIEYYHFEHHLFGEVNYLISPTITITSIGPLVSGIMVPIDEQTKEVFQNLAVNGFSQKMYVLDSWPEYFLAE